MNIKPVSNANPKRSMYLNSAKRGAIMSAGVFAISNTATNFLSPQTAKKAIEKAGGMGKYFKNFAIYLGLSAMCGALFNAGITAISMNAQKRTSQK